MRAQWTVMEKEGKKEALIMLATANKFVGIVLSVLYESGGGCFAPEI